jgi:RNA polymerase-binding protein DksA
MGKFDGLHQKLEKRRAELGERLERIKDDLASPHSRDWDEQAQERENDEVLSQLRTDIEQELRSISNALDRMKHQQYGICSACSAEIPLARLEARPETVHCVKCAA